jgi:hypothetical protein
LGTNVTVGDPTDCGDVFPLAPRAELPLLSLAYVKPELPPETTVEFPALEWWDEIHGDVIVPVELLPILAIAVVNSVESYVE